MSSKSAFKAVETMKFHLGDILSVTTGICLPNPNSKYPIDGLHEILAFMIGVEELYEVELGGVADKCKPALLEQFPELAYINKTSILPGGWQVNFQKLVEKHGEWFEVRRLTE